jgi:hypothetical protein
MQTDPALEWRRLTEHYREIGDEELRELAVDFADLTETAQQVLAQEMRSRGLADPRGASQPPQYAKSADAATESPLRADETSEDSDSITTGAAGLLGTRAPQLVPDAPDTDTDDTGEHDYTWRTYLCECETRQQAQELCEVLKRAGIDCWIASYGLVYPRVLVAADQLDQARAVAAQPIPQEIVDDSKAEAPEYEVPKCPKCGAEDPILESVEPTNHWRCEQCEAEWTEAAEVTDGQAGKS